LLPRPFALVRGTSRQTRFKIESSLLVLLHIHGGPLPERLLHFALVLRVLDHRCGSDLGAIWILTEPATGSALPKQIPTLIELDLDLLQTHLVAIRESLLFVQILLRVH
jgi:hypothetical protein